MKFYHKLILIVILLTSVLLRFCLLNDVPTGLHADESSQGYNAYSLLKTGKDMYGKSFPILFRANGSYQPPVYTYLTTIPVFLFGNTAFSARFVSAFAGSVLVLLTFLLLYRFGFGSKGARVNQALIVSLVVGVSPWAIRFSRLAVEANLVVPFFVAGVLVLMLSLEKKGFFVPACLLFGLSTHVYYTERVTTVLLLVAFLFLFRKNYLERKKEVFLGILLFVSMLVPHLFLVRTGALTKRLLQVGYLNDPVFVNGTVVQKIGLLVGQFFDHYFMYFSPKNLFIDPEQRLGQIAINLSVFYPWFLLLLVIGVYYLFRFRKEPLVKVLLLVTVIAPIPAGMTGAQFYPLRALVFLWALTVVISFGVYFLWLSVKNLPLKIVVGLVVLLYSLFTFYVSYFVVSRYEDINDFGYSYIRLMDELTNLKDKKIMLDYNDRSWGAGIRMTYLLKVDPALVQKSLSSQLRTAYYSGEVNAYETYQIGNVTVKLLDWGEVCGDDLILVGDRYSASESQIIDHQLKLEFVVNNQNGDPTLFGYSTSTPCRISTH